jgi:hypothetical protein
MKSILLVCLSAAAASIASAQGYPTHASLAFEAWNGSAWVRNNIALSAGQSRVEVRAVVDYFAPAGSAAALSSLRYQPVLSNADNTGPIVDDFAPWRNGGVSGDFVANSILSLAEGNDGNALASYGRVGFGSAATNTANQNVITTHRHGGDAPLNYYEGPGAALRVAGSYVTRFPNPNIIIVPEDIDRITRGLVASQSSQFIGGQPNPNYRSELTGIIIFRAAILLGDSTQDRVLGSEDWSQARAGSGLGSTDNRRFSLWHVHPSESIGTLRVDLEHIPLTIVVPAPVSTALLGLGFMLRTRSRR